MPHYKSVLGAHSYQCNRHPTVQGCPGLGEQSLAKFGFAHRAALTHARARNLLFAPAAERKYYGFFTTSPPTMTAH